VEIKDYLKVLGKRAWLLIMIPAVAGVVAGLIAVQQPQAFRTTATLQLPHDVTSSPAEVAQLVADFKAAANNPTVQSKVSKDTGLTLQQIRHMNITQVGDSSQLTLGYQTKAKDPAAAKAVILGISSGALDYLAAPESSSTQKTLDAANDKIKTAQDTADKATTDLNAIFQQINTSTPEDDIKTWKAQVSGFYQQQVAAAAEGNGPKAQAFQDAITERNLQIANVQTVLPKVQELQGQITEAQKVIDDSTVERDAAVAKLTAISSDPDLTFSAEGTPVVRKTRVVKTAAAAVVAGFPIAVGVVLLLDALQKRRKNRPPRPTRDELDELDDDLEPSAADVPLPATATAVDARGRVAPPIIDDVPVSGTPVHEDAPIPAMAAAGAGLAAASLADDADLDDDEADVDDFDSLDIEADLDAEQDAEAEEEAEADEAEAGEADAELDTVVELEDETDVEAAELEAVADEDEAEEEEAVAEAEEADEDEADLEAVGEAVADEDEDLEAVAADDAKLESDGAELTELDDEDLDLDELEDVDELDELEDEDLDDADLDDELDEDVDLTVASRRRMYDADIDDDLSVDGDQAATNGHGRVWARVPAADEDFDGDDEAGADR